MHYISFNDNYGGVYQSQVIDVITTLNEMEGINIKLIAFIPINDFKKYRKKIKASYKNSIVIPMTFGISRWQHYSHFFRFISNKKQAICRGPLAYQIAAGKYSKITYDGRAAVKAEIEEYDVTAGNKKLADDFVRTEKNAVLNADFRIAVSEKLLTFWQETFNYNSTNHVVIPCTLTSKTEQDIATTESNTIKVVYSGGTGGWQSFDLIVDLLDKMLLEQEQTEVLFLTKENDAINNLIKKHPGRCERKWLSHAEVYATLASCDYGILIRDDKVTNQVASPVKFAEYLNAGLQVLISSKIGDFSEFTIQNNCGIIIEKEIPTLPKVTTAKKKLNKELCKNNFYKDSPRIVTSYKKLLSALQK